MSEGSETYGIIARAGSDGLTFLTESIGGREAIVIFDSPDRAASFLRSEELSPKFLVYESSPDQVRELLQTLSESIEDVVLNPPTDLLEGVEVYPVGEFVAALERDGGKIEE